MTEVSSEHKQFLLDILGKVKYLDFKFSYDSLSFPTDKQVRAIHDGSYQHKLRVNIQHYGKDTDGNRGDNCSWLTYCGYIELTEWSEQAILKAIFITLIQKLRHEASETFKFDDKFPFHEHRTENIEIPK